MSKFPDLPKRGIFAIDPSLTGLAVVYMTETGQYDYAELTSKPIKTLEGRLKRYNTLASRVVDLLKMTCPQLCLIEGYSFASKGASVVTLGEFGGVLRNSIVGIADVTVEVPPTVLKKFVTGKGNCGKLEIVTSLSVKYGIEFKTDNHADAFGLALIGKAVLGFTELTNKHQRDTVDIIRKLITQETA
jgi:Holliday junction resolvasome RuvABC endonuclease subunit